jgi:hypothetical protein
MCLFKADAQYSPPFIAAQEKPGIHDRYFLVEAQFPSFRIE